MIINAFIIISKQNSINYGRVPVLQQFIQIVDLSVGVVCQEKPTKLIMSHLLSFQVDSGKGTKQV